MNKSGGIGTATAEAVVRFLHPNGWPHAERRALHGPADQGDITGTPALAWEVKGGKAAEKASDRQVQLWMGETERERVNAKADVGVLVLKRAGYGSTRVGSWWAVVPLQTLIPGTTVPSVPVRLHLGALCAHLVGSGYGGPSWGHREDLPQLYPSPTAR